MQQIPNRMMGKGLMMGEGSPGQGGSKAVAPQDNPEAPLGMQVVHQPEGSVRGSNAMNSYVEESGLAFVKARQDGTLVVLCGIPGAAHLLRTW